MDDAAARPNFSLVEVRATVAQWRGFAVHARDIVNGRSHDWAALRRLRLGVAELPVLIVEGDAENPCRALIDLTATMATVANPRGHFDEVHRLGREVLKRCEMTEAGIDLLAGMLSMEGAAA